MSSAPVASVSASANPFAGPATVTVEGLRVLSVDDTLVCRKLVEVLLTRDGHTVVSAEDGCEALELIDDSAEIFDVVITDHHMPRLDGIGLVRALRARNYPCGIVVISAALENPEAMQYCALGVSAILCKPVSIAQIRDAVNRARPP